MLPDHRYWDTVIMLSVLITVLVALTTDNVPVLIAIVNVHAVN